MLEIEKRLPKDMCPENTCFFTGHRLLSDAKLETVYNVLLRMLPQFAANGIRYYCSGGAIGFDLRAAQAVIQVQETTCPEVRLILTLPCRNQTERWYKQGARGLEAIRIYQEMKARADGIVYTRDFYSDGCMRERNLYMVQHAEHCIACWNGRGQGGTAQTIRLAKKADITIWNIYDASLTEDAEV